MIDAIPMTVLQDYQNRTVVSVRNLKWDNAARTSLTADVLFEELKELGPMPFTAREGSDTRHGGEIWNKANAGDYGMIAAFIPPTPEEARAAMPLISASQIRIALTRRGMIASVPPALDQMAEPARTEATIMWEYATLFGRNDTVMIALFDALGLDGIEADALWAEAVAI